MPMVRVADGDLHYEDDDFVEPWVPHETVVLLAHLSGDAEEYRSWVPTLARHYRVIRPDRRGLGKSSTPPFGYTYTLDSLAADTLALLDAISVEKAHLVGTSGGGIMAIHFAAHHPDRVRSLVAVGTPAFVPAKAQGRFLRDGYPDGPSAVMGMGTWLYTQTAAPLYTSRIHLQNELFKERLGRVAPHVLAGLMRMASTMDITPLLPRVLAPTLLLYAEKGQFDVAEQQMMARTIPACELHGIAGAEGNITWDNPDEAAAVTLEFLRRVTRGERIGA